MGKPTITKAPTYTKFFDNGDKLVVTFHAGRGYTGHFYAADHQGRQPSLPVTEIGRTLPALCEKLAQHIDLFKYRDEILALGRGPIPAELIPKK